MKTRKTILAMAVLLVFMQGQAVASFWDGNKLVGTMRTYEKTKDNASNCSDLDYLEAKHYMGYVTGVYDAFEGILLQAPGNVTVGQICAIVAKYLKNNPEKWNEAAVDLVSDALKEAFPQREVDKVSGKHRPSVMAEMLSYNCEVTHVYDLSEDGFLKTSVWEKEIKGSTFTVSRTTGEIIGKYSNSNGKVHACRE